MFFGCQKDEYYEADQTEIDEFAMYKDDPVFCGEQTLSDLAYNGTSDIAGSFTIGNDAENLYLTFQAAPDWDFYSNWVWKGQIEDIPTNNANKFDPSSFTSYYYNNTNPKNLNTITIPKADIDMDESGCFIISAFAFAKNETTDPVFADEVWATQSHSDSPIGYYVYYCWEECPLPDPLGGPKLAFAYNAEYSECLKDIKRSNAKYNPNGNGTWSNFWLWGWRAGKFQAGTYTFDLIAAAQSCDPEDGILVGEVVLVYDGSSATVSYEVDPAYELISTYAYAGKKRLPKKWKKYTVIPWFYPKKHQNINDVTDSFTFNNKNNGVFLVASAVVKDAE